MKQWFGPAAVALLAAAAAWHGGLALATRGRKRVIAAPADWQRSA
jgi:predicted nucleic acid-binding protein